MQINVFSGARRIAALVAVLWVAGCVAYAVFAEPRAPIYYRVVAATDPFLTDACKRDDVTEWVSKDTPGGDVSITICFALADTADGRRLVPYEQIEGNRVRLGDRYSSEVAAYKRGVADALVMTPEAVQRANDARWASRMENIKLAGSFLVVGLFCFLAFVVAVGWVMRGFMGVTRGRDMRES